MYSKILRKRKTKSIVCDIPDGNISEQSELSSADEVFNNDVLTSSKKGQKKKSAKESSAESVSNCEDSESDFFSDNENKTKSILFSFFFI